MSRNPRRARLRRALTAALAGIGLLAAPFAALPAAAAPTGGPGPAGGSAAVGDSGSARSLDEILRSAGEYRDGRYFVILKDDPAATYRGGTAGLPSTAPADGVFDAGSSAVQQYGEHLTAQHLEVAATEAVSVERHFTTAINGFVSELTAEQARHLAKDPRVLSVTEDVRYHVDYSSTEFLGLPGNRGAWNNHYGGADDAGKGTVVGVIDTGYFPDQEMLAGEPVEPLAGEPEVGEPYLTDGGQIAMLKADGTTFRGACEAGEDFTGEECNSKVLSARYYSEDFETFVPEDQRDPREVLSPIDISSHGTHTATTAAGNDGVEQIMNGQSYGTGSGVAPAAGLAVYKVCWEDTDPDTGSCFGTASVAAIEQAIIDNVDVLNYSISGSNDSVIDPVSLAFKSAAEAGIFVATSAGNQGPAAQTVNHSAPWLTSVGAHTFSNEFTGTVEFPDGTRFRGASSMVEGVGPADIVLASEVGVAGKTADEVRLCAIDALDPALTEGRIVVCDRGVYPRVAKSAAVAEAGGVGMVLVNVEAGTETEDADLHSVPTVHTSDQSIKELVASTDQQATLVPEDTTGLDPVPVPRMAGFSSRGPSTAVDSELLKPDIAAPGVDVLAGVSPLDPLRRGDTFGLNSGTSMAAPNVAGMAALMGAKYPDWSPMAVKSAMMTSAGDIVDADGSTDADNFATGAGSADPADMTAPGLVYESDARQWDAMVLGQLPGREVNLPSIAVNDLLGSVTVTRTVTAQETGTWVARGSVPGYEVTASPSTLSLQEGDSAEVEITLTRTAAQADTWSHGSFTWARPGATPVTSPVTVRAVDVRAEDAVAGEGASGSVDTVLEPGVTGTLEPAVEGLARTEVEEFSKVPGPRGGAEDESNHLTETVVPEGATSVSWSLSGAEGSDWDLFVVTPQETVLQQATGAGTEELVLTDPEPGTYYAISNLYSSPEGASVTGTMESIVLSGDAGNLTVTPEPLTVTNGEPATATLSWEGLTPGTWKGSVNWARGSRTAVTVTVGGEGPGEPGGPAECDLADFADNQPGSPFYDAVRWMACEGLSAGYADNTFRKGQDVTRGETTAFLYRYADPEFTAPDSSPFSDVGAGDTFFTPITWAVSEQITAGYADGTFRPDQAVTRGEFAAFLYRLERPEFTAPETSPFGDVTVSGPNYGAITWLAAEGITVGDSRGDFRPDDEVTRGEIAAFLQRYDRDVAGD